MALFLCIHCPERKTAYKDTYNIARSQKLGIQESMLLKQHSIGSDKTKRPIKSYVRGGSSTQFEFPSGRHKDEICVPTIEARWLVVFLIPGEEQLFLILTQESPFSEESFLKGHHNIQ